MARDPIQESIDQVDLGSGVAPEVSEEEEYRPVFKKFPDSAIRVSKSVGKVWKSRKDQAKSKLKNNGTYAVWDEAIAYYKNDQSGKKNRELANEGESTGDSVGSSRTSNTENIVFANVSSLVPAIYAKNPEVTVKTSKRNDEAAEKTALIQQRLINVLLQKRSAPGVNLKPKIRRAIVIGTLTNLAYIETGYTRKENSSENEIKLLQELSEKLEKAKKEDVAEIEGQLLAMEDKIDLLSPSGPYTRFRHPKDVIVDPDASLGDLTDAKWVMIREVLDTAFINAVYRDKDDESNEYKSIYNPSHLLKTDADTGRDIAGHDIEINSFSLLGDDDNNKYQDFGYDDEESYKKAQKTICWYVWDKVTRRVLLFAEHDWTMPIWVWDDPYGLEEFFSVVPLAFHTDPEDQCARGEVAYYLDQQDEINAINNAVSKFRHRMLNKNIANKRVLGEDTENAVNAFMSPNNKKDVLILDFDPNFDIAKAFMGFPVPRDAQAFLDKGNLYSAIDRLSSVSKMMQGAEYKTNTTNKAIESYESSTQTRLDEKIDAVEEMIGRIGSNILTMCIQFMTQEEVVALIGPLDGEWQNMSGQEAAKSFEMTITGGSSLKPTSKVRKEQAMQIVQVLGQFAAKVPAAFIIGVKVMERAFGDEFDITAEDWAYIRQTIESEQQRGQSQPGASSQPQSPNGGGNGEAANPQQIIIALSQALEKAPPEIRQQAGQAIAQGVPLVEIVDKLMQMAQQEQQPNPQQPQ